MLSGRIPWPPLWLVKKSRVGKTSQRRQWWQDSYGWLKNQEQVKQKNRAAPNISSYGWLKNQEQVKRFKIHGAKLFVMVG